MIDQDVLKKSVTFNEVTADKQSYIYFGSFILPTPLISLPIDPPAWWSKDRDHVLSNTLSAEDKWSNAVNIFATKASVLDYDIDSGIPLRAARAHELLAGADGMQGWSQFILKHTQDFTCTDNGAFIEIVRVNKSIGSRIIGLLHLDGWRCFRTGDPDIPVLYRDRLGYIHELKSHQVITIADMPTPRTTFNGVGFCAASRVYKTIYRTAVIEQYITEKVSGRKPLSVHLVNGISQRQLEEIFKSSQEEANRKGLLSYMGAAVAAMPTDINPTLITIPLSGLPENFDLEKERSNARLEYANALGLDIQDLQPGAIGGSLGSATQAVVLNDKARGKGLAYWKRAFTEQLNLKVLPDLTTFTFVEKDYRDEKNKADAAMTRQTMRSDMVNTGVITPAQALQMAVDEGDAPKEFLSVDETTNTNISSDEKPPEVPAETGTDISSLVQKSLKANRTELVTVTPQFTKPKFPNTGETSYLESVTNKLREYMKLLSDTAKEFCPADKGVLRDSIKYEIHNPDSLQVEGVLFAGNKDRPEVVVRSNLWGRRGFGPKKANGVLAFNSKEGELVFTKHVGSAKGDDWFTRAWNATSAERRAMSASVGRSEADKVAASDVPLANVEHVDGFNPRKGDVLPNTAPNRKK